MNTEARQYKDVSGNPCSLDWLVKHEPEWAANQIRHRDKLEAENKALKADARAVGQSETWFSYDPGDGFETHDTESAARDRAEKALQYYKDEAAGDGWDEEVEQVCWGKCSQKVELLWRKERPPKDQLDENNCDKDGLAWGEWDEMRDYGFRPNEKGQ